MFTNLAIVAGGLTLYPKDPTCIQMSCCFDSQNNENPNVPSKKRCEKQNPTIEVRYYCHKLKSYCSDKYPGGWETARGF